MFTSLQDTRKTLKIDPDDWQWLVDERAKTGKPHKAIIHELIESEKHFRSFSKRVSTAIEQDTFGTKDETK